MSQNINLLEELTVSPASAFSSKLIVQIAVIWILVLTLIYVIATTTNTNKKKTLKELITTQQKLSTKIARHNQESIVATDKNIYLRDISKSSKNDIGFFRYLEDLAKVTPHGVWLNNIIISKPNNAITIHGSAITSFGVSAFINSLNKSKAFNNKEFSNLQIEKNAKSKDVDFTISTISNNEKKDKDKA